MNESNIVLLSFGIYLLWSLGGITATMILHFKYDKLPSHDAGWIGLIYLTSIIAGWLCWTLVYQEWKDSKYITLKQETELEPYTRAFDSHKWDSTYQSYGDIQPGEWITTCVDCGIEYQGHPDEFPDIKYPFCSDMVD